MDRTLLFYCLAPSVVATFPPTRRGRNFVHALFLRQQIRLRIGNGRRSGPVLDALCLASADDPKAKLRDIEDRLNKLRSPFRSAERFWVEEIIDPRKTRSLLCEFARFAEPIRTPGPATHMAIRP